MIGVTEGKVSPEVTWNASGNARVGAKVRCTIDEELSSSRIVGVTAERDC